MTALLPPELAAVRGRFGIAYTSYVVRLAQGRDIFKMTGAALPAIDFLDLCAAAGVAGAQMDVTQLTATDAATLAAVRARAEGLGLFLELSSPPTALDAPASWTEVARIARGLGASCVRLPLLAGRRYESFATADDWHAFVSRWARALAAITPIVDRERVPVAVENHKDWLGGELADLLRRLGSEHIGACIDFGNNLSLLEDPMATVEALAPYAVTTHIKDMAVRRTAEGFELSEVPLGEGVLPLTDMIDTIRRARPDVHFCLEMITREPLPVPYLRESYWTTRDDRPADVVAAFERNVLGACRDDLPTTAGLTPEAAVALEDEHVRRCTEGARKLALL